jgi:hypothetical protein
VLGRELVWSSIGRGVGAIVRGVGTFERSELASERCKFHACCAVVSWAACCSILAFCAALVLARRAAVFWSEVVAVARLAMALTVPWMSNAVSSDSVAALLEDW